MERAISPDERIRRAEEIYQRRREQSYRTNQTRVNVSNTSKDYGLFKKMFLQIVVCLLIYLVFYLIKNSNYIFSEEFLKQSKEVLSYDINWTQRYDEIINWIKSFDIKEETETVPPAETVENEVVEAVSTEIENTADEEEKNAETKDSNIENQNTILEEAQTLSVAEDTSSISQTATDAEEIKTKYSFTKPLEGTITSRFGVRNPTTETVPKYHTGIDIAANTGTIYKAAMAGTVVKVSSEGDYRKTHKNTARRCCNIICT